MFPDGTITLPSCKEKEIIKFLIPYEGPWGLSDFMVCRVQLPSPFSLSFSTNISLFWHFAPFVSLHSGGQGRSRIYNHR